jgi:hypothetical protein
VFSFSDSGTEEFFVQSFGERAAEVSEEKRDSLKSPGANRPYKANAVKVEFGGRAAFVPITTPSSGWSARAFQ